MDFSLSEEQQAVFDMARAGHLPVKVQEVPLEAVSDVWQPAADPDLRVVLTTNNDNS